MPRTSAPLISALGHKHMRGIILPILATLIALALGLFMTTEGFFPATQSGHSKLLARIRLIGPVLIVMGLFMLKETYSWYQLEQVAIKISQDLRVPAMHDNDTRLSSVYASGPKEMTFVYTLVRYSLDSIALRIFAENKRKTYAYIKCQNHDFTILLKTGISIKNRFFTSDNKEAFSVAIDPSDCEFQKS